MVIDLDLLFPFKIILSVHFGFVTQDVVSLISISFSALVHPLQCSSNDRSQDIYWNLTLLMTGEKVVYVSATLPLLHIIFCDGKEGSTCSHI